MKQKKNGQNSYQLQYNNRRNLQVSPNQSAYSSDIINNKSYHHNQNKIQYHSQLLSNKQEHNPLIRSIGIFDEINTRKQQDLEKYKNQIVRFNQLSKIQQKSIKPKGLINLGNTCYLNAIIQSLLSIKELELFLETADCFLPSSSLSEELRRLKQQADDTRSPNFPTQPSTFKDRLDKFFVVFQGNKQQDAAECLTYILMQLGIELNKVKKAPQKNNLSISHEIRVQAESAWKDYRSREDSVITDLFNGMLFNIIMCWGCKDESLSFEECNNILLQLPIDVSTPQPIDLRDLFNQSIQEEYIMDGFQCVKCQQKTGFIRKAQYWRLPKVLVVHLKRFDRNQNRINLSIKFPLENLNLSRLVQLALFNDISPNDQFNYNLRAIVHHIGNCQNGHYYATCRKGERWFRFDDENVTEMNKTIYSYETVGSTTPYLLIYEKI